MSEAKDEGDVGVVAPEKILEYWFSGTPEDQRTRHWKGLKETDDEIRAQFLPTWVALSDKSNTELADKWAAAGIRSVLALIIVWDQFSRSLWRGDGKSFANDDRAGKLARRHSTRAAPWGSLHAGRSTGVAPRGGRRSFLY